MACFELRKDALSLLFSDERRLNLLWFQFINMDGEGRESVLNDAVHERCIALRKRPVLKSRNPLVASGKSNYKCYIIRTI